MSDDPYDLGPMPSFLGCDDYRDIWIDQAKPESRYSRNGLWSESGEDPDELRRMPYSRYLRSDHWAIVRQRALAVAEGRCFYCAATDHLDVHHLTYRRRGCELDEDLIVLCRACHAIEHLTDEEIERDLIARGPTDAA
jgi:5-methylcytosine-specific restriction endonuclease McrA